MLIQGGTVAAPDGRFERLDLRVEGGIIAECVPGLDAEDGETVIDATRRLVVPGLVNAHYHSNEGYLRGSYDRLSLEAWLAYAYPFTNVIAYTERDIYIRTLVGAIELLRSGTTAVVDFLYDLPAPTPETLRPVFEAYRDAGIRAVVAVSLWDLPWTDTVPVRRDVIPADLLSAIDATPPSPADWLELCRATIDEWHGVADTLAVGLAPSGPQRCSDDFLLAIRGLADERDLAVHTHTLETRVQRYTGRLAYETTLVRHLATIGVLSERVSLAHGIWIDEDDIDLIARHGASVVHNPQANLKLGDGIAPVPELLRAGVNVAIGTDGMSTNDTRDMYEALKLAALLHRVSDPTFDAWPGAADAWRMATLGGARSANLAVEIGLIEVGRRADLVLLDLDDIAFTPLNDPLIHLVFSMPSRAVREVVVQGRLVVRDGRVATLDETAVLAEARDRAENLRGQREASHEEAPRLMPALLDVHERAWSTDVGVERYARRPRD